MLKPGAHVGVAPDRLDEVGHCAAEAAARAVLDPADLRAGDHLDDDGAPGMARAPDPELADARPEGWKELRRTDVRGICDIRHPVREACDGVSVV